MNPGRKDSMSSRARLIAAIDHREPDRVPICFRDVAPLEHRWNTPFERVLALRELGVDDKLFLHPPGTFPHDTTISVERSLYLRYGSSLWEFHPDVTVREWKDMNANKGCTVLYKVMETPAGTLQMAARKTGDWQVSTLPIVSDHLWSRGIEFPVKGPEDLDKLRYLLYDQTAVDLSEFHERVKQVKFFAAKHDVLVEGDVNAASNIALSLRGPTQLMCDAVDNPGFVEELLNMITTWNLKRLELLLDYGVDTVYHTACYETTAFWSPYMYRRFFAPFIKKKLAMIHEAGARMHYYMDIGTIPLIEEFKTLGIDILSTIDPVPYGDTDIESIKRAIRDTVCLWGGVDAPHTIERGTPDDVRKAVKTAISHAAPGGGFVLSTADSVTDHDAYETVMAFIRAGLEFGRYPISL
jgi:hypothetical protein